MSFVVSGVVQKVSLKSLTAAEDALKEADDDAPWVWVWVWTFERWGEPLELRLVDRELVWIREKVAASIGRVSREEGLISDCIMEDVVL